MFIVKRFKNQMAYLRHGFTGTPLELPIHYLPENVKEGDTIRFYIDEVTTRRMEKENEQIDLGILRGGQT